jgi:hypothetical protein
MGFEGILAERGRRQLILIADEDHTLWVHLKRDQTGQLCTLTGFIND